MNLRERALKGGTYLVGRHFAMVALAVVGQPLLARMIGPAAYGIWVAARQIVDYASLLSGWGIDVYLLRKEGELSKEHADQGFTLLAILGTSGTLVTLLAVPWIQRWTRLAGFSWVLAGVVCSMPLSLVSWVALNQLERALEFRAPVRIELAGRVVFYSLGLALAFWGWGVWGLVCALWSERVLTLALLHRAAHYRPRLRYDRALAREMVGYGLGYAASTWIYQLRSLVVPFIVGRYANATAVGYIGLAERLLAALGFAKTIGWRLAMVVLAKVQDDRTRLGRAISEGVMLQVLALSPLLLVFGLLLPYLVPWVFGARWVPMEQIFPFLAVGYLASSMFNLHSSALYVLRRNGRVAIFYLAHVLLFGGAAFFFVRRLGWIGYGWAEIAALSSYAVIHLYTAAEVRGLDYGLALPISLATGLALFVYQIGWPAVLGLVALAAWPQTWRVLGRYTREILKPVQSPGTNA
jgi:PST family polysaccharide transporter